MSSTYLSALESTPKLPNASFTHSRAISHFRRFVCEPHQQAAKDFRTRWRRCGLWLLLAAWLAVLLYFLVSLSWNTSGSVGIRPSACLPDDSFAMDPSHFQYLSSSGFFQITLGFGNMSFTQVKAIDIAWDILVGRGGQALVAYVSWRIFAKYVTTSMEITPITFGTYRTIFLPGSGLLVSILCMVRDFITRHGLHSKTAMVFMVYTMVFTFVYPTLASAMTGYSANVDAYVNTTGGEYVPFSSFSFVTYIVHDGWRINQTFDYIVEGNNTEMDGRYWYYYNDKQPVISRLAIDQKLSHCHDSFPSFNADFKSEACELQRNISKYAADYGLNGGTLINSTFGGEPLPPPILNISAPSVVKDTSRLVSNSYVDLAFDINNNPSLWLWAYDNETYHLDYMQKNGKCQAALDYKWGFSYIQLFIMVILHIVWTVGLYIMWLRAYMIMNKRGRGKEDIAGEHKAIFELAAAMRVHLNRASKEEGNDVSTLTEMELRRRITKELRGGSISYTTPLLLDEAGDKTWNIKIWVGHTKAWIKTYKLSIPTMIICGAAVVLAVYSPSAGIFTLVTLPIELGIALYIGSTRKSRIVIFVWAFLLVTVPTAVGLFIAFYY